MASPEGYPTFRLCAAVHRGVTLSEQAAVLAVRRENHLAAAADVRDRFRDLPMALANAVTLSEPCRSDVAARLRRPAGQAAARRRAARPPGQDL
jgi:DNA polymerase III alpha subunit